MTKVWPQSKFVGKMINMILQKDTLIQIHFILSNCFSKKKKEIESLTNYDLLPLKQGFNTEYSFTKTQH